MSGIYAFWLWFIAASLVYLFFVGSKHRIILSAFYQGSVLVAFASTTLFHVRGYLHAALGGYTDSAIGLMFQQAVINPSRFIFGIGGSRLTYWALGDITFDESTRCAGFLAVILWEVLFEDLLFGSLFWFGVTTMWMLWVRHRLERTS